MARRFTVHINVFLLGAQVMLILGMLGYSVAGADGFPVIVSSPSPTPAVISSLTSIVNSIPGGESTAMSFFLMFMGGLIDLVVRRWPTAKPRDLLRTAGTILRVIAQAFVLLAQGAEKVAVIGDRILGQNVQTPTPPPEGK